MNSSLYRENQCGIAVNKVWNTEKIDAVRISGLKFISIDAPKPIGKDLNSTFEINEEEI